ncbi:CPBP family intramembrane glutamic endopeptidase [Ectobacillus polymachus]|uniref:CPBP family intramembrane glutamic endopeptidase n=1 Tax=Ectobacillus polymachus TaxID=1508806 RepID=UPI003A89D519
MNQKYWWIIITYIVMQISSLLGIPLLLRTGWYHTYSRSVQIEMASAHWAIISFVTALIIILLLLRHDDDPLARNKMGIGYTILWMFAGIFLALFAQTIAANIEMRIFGINPGSENTQRLVDIAKVSPLFILVTSIFGPIMEEIVFRKILFGSLYKHFHFFVAAIISSLIFATVHFDFSHLLVYTSMGFVFSFLYIHTRRIIVPIFAHVMMNTIVILINIGLHDYLDKMMKQAETLHTIIGGF